MTIEELKVVIEADISKFTKNINKAKKQVSGIEKEIGVLNKLFSKRNTINVDTQKAQISINKIKDSLSKLQGDISVNINSNTLGAEIAAALGSSSISKEAGGIGEEIGVLLASSIGSSISSKEFKDLGKALKELDFSKLSNDEILNIAKDFYNAESEIDAARAASEKFGRTLLNIGEKIAPKLTEALAKIHNNNVLRDMGDYTGTQAFTENVETVLEYFTQLKARTTDASRAIRNSLKDAFTTPNISIDNPLKAIEDKVGISAKNIKNAIDKILSPNILKNLGHSLKDISAKYKNIGDSAATGMKKAETATNKAAGAAKSLLDSLTPIAAAYGIYELGKSAIEAASNLEEVQNVVDVAFGEMSDAVNNFAKTAMQQFGLTELQAKQFSSTFMAMAQGMDINSDAAYLMSLNLAALSGDLASFYNVSQEVAETALESVFTGETETLKKFGIVITEANLQAYALANGINKSISEMSQAEKVALRYNYVLAQTSLAQGDFASTTTSWANQVRILQGQWTTFLSILGKGLTVVLKPLVQVLNVLLGYLISIANAIARVFGGSGIAKSYTKISDSLGNSAKGAQGLADGAKNSAAGLDSANKSAEKLKKTIAGFDELNILDSGSKDSAYGSGSNNGNDSGTSIGAVGELGGYIDVNSYIDKTQEQGISERLKNFLEDCRGIIEKWAQTIPPLKINFDKAQALNNLYDIGTQLTNILTGWGSFVITIAIKVLNDLDIGKLANNLLQLADDATYAASELTNAVVPALTNFYDAGISPIVQWIGEKLADALSFTGDLLRSWGDWFKENQKDIAEFGSILGEVVNTMWQFVEPLLNAAWEIFKGVLSTISGLLQDIGKFLLDHKELIGTILDLLAPFAGIAADIFLVVEAVGALSGIFGTITGVVGTVVSAIGSISGIISTVVSFVTGAVSAVVGVLGAPITIILAIVGTVAVLYAKCEWFRNGVNALIKGIINFVKSAADAIVRAIKALVDGVVNLFSSLKDKISDAIAKIKECGGQLISDISSGYEEIKAKTAAFIDKFISSIAKFIGDIKNKFVELKNSAADTFTNLHTTISSKMEMLKSALSDKLNFIKNKFSETWQTIKNSAKAPINGIISMLNGLIRGVGSAVNAVVKALNKLNISIPDWVPKFGGKKFGFNLKTVSIAQIPYLANGGVIDSPTVAMLGEYPNAKRNPEIAAPESKIREIISSSNDDVVSAMIQLGRQLISAIENVDMNVSIGDDIIARSASRGNDKHIMRTGQPLFNF